MEFRYHDAARRFDTTLLEGLEKEATPQEAPEEGNGIDRIAAGGIMDDLAATKAAAEADAENKITEHDVKAKLRALLKDKEKGAQLDTFVAAAGALRKET